MIHPTLLDASIQTKKPLFLVAIRAFVEPENHPHAQIVGMDSLLDVAVEELFDCHVSFGGWFAIERTEHFGQYGRRNFGWAVAVDGLEVVDWALGLFVVAN
jgi:hypothetical protein